MRDSSRRRRDAERTSVRDAIFAAAEALLLEHGYEGFSLRQVAERIGYTPTTIYRHFADRDALIFALTDAGFREFGARLHAAAAAAPAADRVLTALGDAYIQFGLDHPVYYRLMFLQRPDYLVATPPDSDEMRLDSFRVLRDAVDRALPPGVAEAMGGPDALADVLWATVHGVVALALTMPHFDAARTAAMRAGALALLDRALHA
ncbi:MAG: TetR/AcrR family transcriptional regulator [Gemmatirosa sp.]|nr:TetR/AcrR family transcriptional regulator [Gemmatirosa sp.]